MMPAVVIWICLAQESWPSSPSWQVKVNSSVCGGAGGRVSLTFQADPDPGVPAWPLWASGFSTAGGKEWGNSTHRPAHRDTSQLSPALSVTTSGPGAGSYSPPDPQRSQPPWLPHSFFEAWSLVNRSSRRDPHSQQPSAWPSWLTLKHQPLASRRDRAGGDLLIPCHLSPPFPSHFQRALPPESMCQVLPRLWVGEPTVKMGSRVAHGSWKIDSRWAGLRLGQPARWGCAVGATASKRKADHLGSLNQQFKEKVRVEAQLGAFTGIPVSVAGRAQGPGQGLRLRK